MYAFSYVSSSGGNYAVPSVQGEPLAKAQQDIANAHLVSRVVREPSTTVSKNDVISTTPPAGTSVPKGSTVTLYVSSGAGLVAVPAVVGDTAAAASSTLQAAGFLVNEQPVQNSTAPSGQVVRQIPKAGTQEARGSTVTIFVSGGGTKVPPVVGETQTQATTDLENAGFLVNTVTEAPPGSGFTPGTVWKTNPTPGSVLEPNTTVTIYVVPQASTAPPTTPPSSTPPSSTPPTSTPPTSTPPTKG